MIASGEAERSFDGIEIAVWESSLCEGQGKVKRMIAKLAEIQWKKFESEFNLECREES